MIKNTEWMTYSEYLPVELIQAEEEGKEVTVYKKQVADILKLPEYAKEREEKAYQLLAEIETLPVKEAYVYKEPNELEEIRKLRKIQNVQKFTVPKELLFDKVYGAWTGRCAGCLLGQPIEGWYRERIRGFLLDTDNYPVKHFLSSDVPQDIIDRYQVSNNGENAFCDHITHWINNVTIMTEDDDTNYTALGLKVLEEYGYDFTSDDVAWTWITSLPMGHVSTSERVAYRNIGNLIEPPRCGWWKNPYREWIGAQIRADIFGYVSPGDPELAASLAWKDARISHVKNGIYGEMFVAAMLAAAYGVQEPDKILEAGIEQIPATSRLYNALKQVMEGYRSGMALGDAIEKLHNQFDETNSHDWCHTISNAVVVAISLLYGGLDFEKSLGIAMECGFDTDCNGATIGSVVGLAVGYKGIPDHWKTPVGDILRTGVSGFHQIRIKELVDRTIAVIHNR
ncbi:ADP-ribosylglycohydrolase family protein [Lachnospiraceae bacterium ASD3451]|uniref:ADP-ribosylglycohydrolase family protein n=1 Tax=Diplocloster agilis TaxID=2850323 RepID=UPI001D5CE8FB|nr:ADP-ribosylglycohydrolase family protein [Diplocloster agilis]MBU9744329.1 ADP-ribosylglycohydrolase family protein [Diplocloster agilis]